MALEKISTQNQNFYNPAFKVEINNKKLAADMSAVILEVTIEEKINEGASFTIILPDQFDQNTQEFKWLDHPLLQVGNTVNIKMGYASNLDTMMEGKISLLEPAFFSGEIPSLTIKGQDLSYNFIRRESPPRVFKDMTYSSIAKTIANEAGLQAKVDNTQEKHDIVTKTNNESYFAFLQRLGKKTGFQFTIAGKTMYFGKPGTNKKEIMTLQLGKDIISFNPTLKTTELFTEVEVRCHNPMDPENPIIGRAKTGSENNSEPGKQTASQLAKKEIGKVKKVITTLFVTSTAEAEKAAKAELDKAGTTLIQGQVETIGIPQIRAGVNIKMDKLGNRFSGKYYVNETTHTINSSGYKTRFSATRSEL